MELIERALGRGQKNLSEYESKLLLKAYEIPVAREKLVQDQVAVLAAAREIGYPVVLKFCSPWLPHKTEKSLIELDIRDEATLKEALRRLRERAEDSQGGFLVQEMVKGSRELVMGMIRDAQFGPCVMFGLGGIFTEVLNDVSFRAAPLTRQDASEMMAEIQGRKILEAIRGLEAVDREAILRSLISLGRLGLENETIQEVDVNPLIVRGSQPLAVDALVVLVDPPQKVALAAA